MILGTPHMTSTKAREELNVMLDNTALEGVKFTKFLGVLIDECLTWKNHINCISKTISRNIGVMNKLKHYIPYRISYTLYCTSISPYLSYGILTWGNTCKSYLDKLVKLQKWAIRVISNSHYRCHTAPLFAKCNILTVTDMYSLELGVFMYVRDPGMQIKLLPFFSFVPVAAILDFKMAAIFSMFWPIFQVLTNKMISKW